MGTAGADTAIWALGLRNPFRASFDPLGRLTIGDVGAGSVEEVNIGSAGANFGWPTCEGRCGTPGFVNPVYSYDHSGSPGGCAIIGGGVVRVPTLAGLNGRYLYGDLCDGDLRSINLSVAGGSRMIIRARRLRADSRGRVRIALQCKGTVACSGSVALLAAPRSLRSSASKTIAVAKYRSVAVNRTVRVRVRLRRAGRNALTRRDRLRVTARTRTRTLGSTTTRVVTRKLHVLAAR